MWRKVLIASLALLGVASTATAQNAIYDKAARTVAGGTGERWHCDIVTATFHCTTASLLAYIQAQMDTEAELEAILTDMADIIQAAEMDTEAELEALVAGLNFIISTELNTEAKLEALVAGLNFIISTEIDTQAELESLLTDATDILDVAEINTEAELEAIVAGLNFLISTELDTQAELESLLTDATNLIDVAEMDTEAEFEALVASINFIIETEMDSGAELLALYDDETGTGVPVFSISPTFTGDPLAPTATAEDNDTSIASTAFVRLEEENMVECTNGVFEDLAAADDNYSLGMAQFARTVTHVGVHCDGTCSTAADIDLSDRAGNAMTHAAPTVSVTTGSTTLVAVTAANTLLAGEGLEFSVANAVSPETDKYTIVFCWNRD